MSNPQTSIFDVEKGKQLREQAITRVTQAAPNGWKDQALAAFEELAAVQVTVTTDDVWNLLDAWGVEPPPERRAMAAPVRRAEKLGLIRKTDRFVPSALPWAHRRNMQVWESRLR